MRNYYLNTDSQFRTLSFTIYSLILCVLLVIYDVTKGDDFVFEIKPIVIVFAIVYFYVLLMYVQYLSYSLKRKISMDIYHRREITFSHKKTTKTYSFDDIESITKVCSIRNAENRTPWIPSDSFFFILIKTKSGDTIILTSLMIDNTFHLPNFKIKIKKRILPFILNKDLE